MMRKYKGIVCEKKATYSVFLTEEGEFLRGIPLISTVQVGEEAEFHLTAHASSPNRMKPIFIAPALIAAMLLIILVASWFPQTTPAYAYINVEGDSKIEIGIDEDGKVISLQSTAEKIKDWEGQSIDHVLAKAVEQVGAEEKELAVTTVYEKEDKPKLNKQIEKAVKQVKKDKPSSKKRSAEPEQKKLKPVAKPPGQMKKEEKDSKSNNKQNNSQKPAENKNNSNGNKETPAKVNEPKGKTEKPTKENNSSNNANKVPGQEKKNNEEKSNNGNSSNKNNGNGNNKNNDKNHNN